MIRLEQKSCQPKIFYRLGNAAKYFCWVVAENSLLHKGLILRNELSNELKIERMVNVCLKKKCAIGIFVKQYQ